MKDDRLYLIHIQECIQRIEGYTAGGKDDFFADTKTQDAVLRNLQILAESTQRISDSLKTANPEIDWRSVSAFRNILVHGYLSVDLKRIWDIIDRDVPDLKAKIEGILRKSGVNRS